MGDATVRRFVDIVNITVAPARSHCQQQNVDISNKFFEGVLASPTVGTRVAKRPIFHKHFGTYLKRTREDRHWKPRHVLLRAHKIDKRFNRNLLIRLEAGQVKHPKPWMIQVLSGVYGVDRTLLIDLLEKDDLLVVEKSTVSLREPSDRVTTQTKTTGGEHGRSAAALVESRVEKFVRAVDKLYERFGTLYASIETLKREAASEFAEEIAAARRSRSGHSRGRGAVS